VCYIPALENQILLEHCIIISQGQSSNTSKFFGLFHINGNINPAEILRNQMVNSQGQSSNTSKFFGLFHINGNINPAEILRNHMVNHKHVLFPEPETSLTITRVFVNKP